MNNFLEPIDDKIIIKKENTDGVTSGGLIIPEESQGQSKVGIVIAVGPGLKLMDRSPVTKTLLTEGEYQNTLEIQRIGMKCKVGDKVIFSQNHGIKFEYKDEEYIVQREGDILTIIND